LVPAVTRRDAEALEAVGFGHGPKRRCRDEHRDCHSFPARPARDRIFAASQGAAALPVGEIMMLVGLFLVFFGIGVYIAVVLGALALLSGFIFSDRPFWLFWAR